ncbi:hypothetical protein BXT84_03975 [Sulfobacillus thermotolerans]|uniref:Sporulation protein YqfD n=1 Tax=Sulfobacillus thermotolerans TaxID=338644 RepID=A0ABN5GXU8_9FIRM|nr:hypothetical protein BXT84_03975 [Sulfobacillus thermotolerans]
MIDFLYRLVFGWIEITLTGRNPEEAISRLVLAGPRLWNVRQTDKGYTFTVSLQGIVWLRKSVRGYHCRVRFGRRGGLPFKVQALKQRPFLGVGALTALFLIVFATSRIWVIDAPGANISHEAQEQLVAAAEQAGVHIGMLRSRMNLNAERQRMQRRLPQYAWIGLSVHGMLVTIHVIPLVNRPPDALPSKLVAARDGVVTSVLVFIGDPEVVAGERVHKGQTLISGAVSAQIPVQPPDAKQPITDAVKTPAKGDVFADVRYAATWWQPFRFWALKPTGRRFEQDFLKLADGEPILLKGYGAVPFRYYWRQKIVQPLQWREVTLPVEEVKIVYNELQRRHQLLSRKQALARAVAEVTQRLQHEAHGGTRVREQRIVHWTKQGVSVHLIWTVNQNIAVPPA